MSDDEAAVTAHWLLGRLSVLQASIAQLSQNERLSEHDRAELSRRAHLVSGEMQGALEDLARGLPAEIIDLVDHPVPVPHDP